MTRTIMVQARMGSTRLPGKVLKELAGRPMLAQQLRRLRQCRLADEIVVLTSTSEADRAVVELAEAEGFRWYRGSEQDVLSRFVGAARECHADVVVRVTADCPLIDPEVTDCVIDALAADEGWDYASNVIHRTYPRGLDSEAMYCDTLERIGRLARSPGAREHVTAFVLQERPELFLSRSVMDRENNADLRWTVDTEDDLRFVRWMYEQLALGEEIVPYRAMVKFARTHRPPCGGREAR